MKLLKLSYSDLNWEIKDLELDSVNLIVAKNSTGKSRTLRALDLFIKIIVQPSNFLDNGGNWEIEFINDTNQVIKYHFSKIFDEIKQQSLVTEERLFLNDKELLIRIKNEAKINNFLSGDFESVYPPENKLVLHTNRDIKKYPYLEEITKWAENSHRFLFANIISSSNLNRTFSGLDLPDIPYLFRFLNEGSCQSVLTQFNSLGYNILAITAEHKNDDVIIFVKEKGVEKSLRHWELSQGMYRSLSTIILIEYLTVHKKPTLILIDDLCEGLDYDRAIKLGKLIFQKCKDSDIQLIAASNDSFLMDVVDIKYWNVLYRNGNIVTAFNIKNHPKIFEKFRFTGLSNFDFFASDFLTQQIVS